jgi:hypothetical protein
MPSSANQQAVGLSVNLLDWGGRRLPPGPVPQQAGVTIRGPLRSTRKISR